MPLKVGDQAPEFERPATTGGKIALFCYRGKKNVLHAFYALSWAGV